MAGTYEQATLGEPNATAGPKWLKQFKGMNEVLNSSNLLEDTGLASPNNGAYRTLFSASQIFTNATAGGTYILGSEKGLPKASASNISGALPLPMFYFAKADYEVANKTQKLRLRAQFSPNSIGPVSSLTPGLYPVTVAGPKEELKFTLGTVVTGSNTASVGEPAASTVTSKETSDFTIPSNGLYCLGLFLSTNITEGSVMQVSAQLQTRSV